MAGGKKDAAYRALQRLMEEPGLPGEMLLDLAASLTDDPADRLARMLGGKPDYDDRAAALVYGAMVEQSLEIALSTHFVVDVKESNRLFSYADDDGYIANFAAKIALGHALGIYDHQMRGDLTWIRHIRNAFAHARLDVGFHTEAIILACDQLRFPRHNPKWVTPRQKFTATAGLVAMFLRGAGISVRPLRFDHPGVLAIYSLYYPPSPDKSP